MRASRVKTVRSLDRGLDVLLALEGTQASSLHELHVKTRLPKATLTRILLTLARRGLIWQRVADNRYRPAYAQKGRARHIDDADRVVETASPVLFELARETGLGANLAVPRDDHMELCEASRPGAPGKDSKERVGCKVNMLRSGLGLAFLAFCNDNQRQETLKKLRASGLPGNAIVHNAAWVKQVLDDTRRRGYGIRCENYGQDFDKPKRESNDGMAAIAVPIMVGDRAVGSINLRWGENLATHNAIARRHLKCLKAAAERIAQSLSDET